MAFSIDALASIIGHWSADQITGHSDGDPVAVFPDSVDSWSMQATGAARPVYRPAGIGGLPSIEFDGVDDFMQSATSRTLTAGTIGSAAVIRVNVEKNFNTFGSLHFSASLPQNGVSPLLAFGYQNRQLLSRVGSAFQGVFPPLAANTDFVIAAMHSKRTFTVTANGDGFDVSADTAPADFTGGELFAGFGSSTLSNAFLDGHLSEWVLWQETELCESVYVEGALAHKYGIALPSSHPFSGSPPAMLPGHGGSSTTHNPFRSRALAG